MNNQLTYKEIEKRFAEIEAREPEKLTPEESEDLAFAEAIDDGAVMTLEEFRQNLEKYSGKFAVQVLHGLHK